jgi:hypothetical protein
MHTAEASITTDRAERYLTQLCSHLGQMQHMRHLPKGGHGGAGVPRVEHVEQAPGRAVIRFADGAWTLNAEARALQLRVEAEDPTALERLKDAIAARIAKIGRRDGLTVVWHESGRQDTHDEPGGAGHAGRGSGPGRRSWWRRLGWFTVIGLAAAIHIGLIGSLLGSGWDAAASAILALVAVKLVLFALHARFGRERSSHG